jgi:hypothetical protein
MRNLLFSRIMEQLTTGKVVLIGTIRNAVILVLTVKTDYIAIHVVK